jgi:SIR2-like protein
MSSPIKQPTGAQKVIILGAGASAADGAPLQAGLFRKYAEIIQRNSKISIRASSEGELRTFFDLFWGSDIDNPNLNSQYFPTFEEALGLLEMANARGEYFKGFGGMQTEATRAQEMRAHLANLIAIVLDDALQSARHTHSDLVAHLKNLSWMDTVSFISFNYDLLIDNALRTRLQVDPDYSVPFRWIENPFPAQAGLTPPTLLKLHGSLNWLFCPTCNQLDCYPGEKIVAQIAHDPMRMPCAVCQEPRVPILVPPTFFKVMSNFYLQQIWRQTEARLREADHLIFCGYSFPDADIHFKYLLKRAEINQPDLPRKRLEVFIINEHPGKSAQQRDDEKHRYIRFFREKDLVHWTKLSFKDFADDPAAYADPANWI